MPSSLNLAGVFNDAIAEHLAVIREFEAQQDAFERAAILITDSLLAGHKILWCGNGGSAADCQHLASALVGRFRRDRAALFSIALTSDTSVLTGVANDYGYDTIFERQVEGICMAGDVVIGMSTSGNCQNVFAALRLAKQMHAGTIAMTGLQGGRLQAIADICLRVPARDPARIQEGHMLCGHILCEWVELATCISRAVAAGEDAQ